MDSFISVLAWSIVAMVFIIPLVLIVGLVFAFRTWSKTRKSMRVDNAPSLPAASSSIPAAMPGVEPKLARVPPRAKKSTDPRYTLDIGPMPLQLAVHVGTARAAREAGMIAEARDHYQRAAYGFNQLTAEQNEALKREIASLTRDDPLYIESIALLKETLRATPGALQSDLGKAAGPNREALNYVLYYAAELGDIVRVKSGRSYRLYLPGQPIHPAPEKPARSRAKRTPKGE